MIQVTAYILALMFSGLVFLFLMAYRLEKRRKKRLTDPKRNEWSIHSIAEKASD